MRTVAIGTRTLAYLAHVDTNAHTRQIALQCVRVLQSEGKYDRRAWRLEGQKAAVSSPVHDSSMHLRRNLSYLLSMPSYQLFHCLIATLPLQRSGIREVGEDERENPGDPGRVSHRESHSWRQRDVRRAVGSNRRFDGVP
jgi:hypothetical protein